MKAHDEKVHEQMHLAHRNAEHHLERKVSQEFQTASGKGLKEVNMSLTVTFQETIVAWFTQKFSLKARVVLAELKAFIVGCFQYTPPRVAMFRHFFSRSLNANDTTAVDSTSCLDHFISLHTTLFPDLRFRWHINDAITSHDACHVSVRF